MIRHPQWPRLIAIAMLFVASVSPAALAAETGLITQWEPVLGAYCVQVPVASALATDLGTSKGKLLIVSVGGNLTAHRAGVVRGDVILSIAADLAKPGSDGSLLVLRNRKELTLKFQVPVQAHDVAKLVESPVGDKRAIIVDAQGHGQYRTVTAALAFSAPGDTIRLRSGVYRETIAVPSGVTLESEAENRATLEADTVVYVTGAHGIVLRGLRIAGKNQGVYFNDVRDVKLDDCTITSATGTALLAQGLVESLIIEHCRLSGKLYGGQVINGQVVLRRCVIANSNTGIRALKQSAVELTDCTFDGNENGILSFNSKLSVRNSMFLGASSEVGRGISSRDSQTLTETNSFRRFPIGVEVRGGKAEVIANRFLQNQFGIWVRGGEALIRRNTIIMSSQFGIFVSRQTFPGEEPIDAAPKALIERNTVAYGRVFGILVMDQSEAEIRYNLVENNGRGIEIRNSNGEVANNTIVLQNNRGLEFAAGSKGSVFNNIIALNRLGFAIADGVTLERDYNNVYGNIASRTFPLEASDYVRVSAIPLTQQEELPAELFPATDLRAPTDLSVDPQFVETGKDYQLTPKSPLAGRTGRNGLLIGAFGVSDTPVEAIVDLGRWKNKLVFADSNLTNIQSRSSIGPTKAWTSAERMKVLRMFAALEKKAPGLIERATAYRPIVLYRVSRAPRFLEAMASPEDNSICLGDSAVRGHDRAELSRLVWHEVTHLADVLWTTSSSSAWTAIALPRIQVVADTLAAQGLTNRQASIEKGNPYRKLCLENGLPSVYAAKGPEEALAECVSCWLAGTWEPPLQMKLFLDSFTAAGYAPDEAVACVYQALQASDAGQFDEAQEHFDKALTMNASLAQAYAYRGELRLKQQNIDGAIADLSETLRLRPWSYTGYYNRAAALLQKGTVVPAVEDLTEALALADFPSEKYQASLVRGEAHRKLGKLDQALADLTQAINTYDRSSEAYYARGSIFAEKKRYDEAVSDFDKALRLAPRFIWAHVRRADVLLEMGEESRAVNDLQSALRLIPPTVDSAILYSRLADLLATASESTLRDGERGLMIAKRICELTEWKNSTALEAFAAASAETNDFAIAIQWQKKAIDLGSSTVDQRQRLALYESKKAFHRASPPSVKRGQQ